MNILEKFLFWLSKLTTGGLLVLLLLGAAGWGYFRYQGYKEQKQVQAATVIVKEKINDQPTDLFSGCVHPDNLILVTVNRQAVFAVKDNEVFIPRLTDWYNKNAQSWAPALPIKDENIDIYYLVENCL